MKKFFWVFNFLLALSVIQFAQAADKIAVINMQQAFQESPEQAAMMKKAEEKFKKRAVDLAAKEKSLKANVKKLESSNSKNALNTMNKSEREALQKTVETQNKEFVKEVQSFQKDNYDFRKMESDKILKSIQAVVKSIATTKGYDAVIDTNAVIYASGPDITTDVLNKLKQQTNKAKK